MKKTSSSQTRSDRAGKTGKARGPVRRDAKEVMAELWEKLSQKLDPQGPPAADAAEERQPGIPVPNRDRLTVGVDLGDKWSHYCILGLDGEKLTEGELGTTPQEFVEFFQGMTPARVAMEVGTYSAWAREAVTGCGYEVLVANPRQMEGPKRRQRKNDQVRSICGGPGLEIGPQHAPGPQRLIQRADRSAAVSGGGNRISEG